MNPANKPINALTIDVEDWIQSVYDVDAPLTDCFVHNTRRILELLSVHRTRATFFVLGLAAQKAPGLVREIQAAGHEIQSHGFGHRLIHTQTRQDFRDDIRKSKLMLEDLTGHSITGYRAPAFSITPRTFWAIDELIAAGFRFDSSIFPIRMRRYGISGTPASPFRLATSAGGSLIEFPVCTMRLGPIRLPAGGGGYFRTAPCWYTSAALRQTNMTGHPAALYLHPYEFAPEEWRHLPRPIPLRTRLQQGLGRRTVARKLGRLLTTFRFTTMGDAVSAAAEALPSLCVKQVNSCQTANAPVFNPA